jgi:hypothetical protein
MIPNLYEAQIVLLLLSSSSSSTDYAMLGLFSPLEECVGPTILTVGALHFIILLGCMLKFLSEFVYLWLYSSCGPWPPFQFLNLYTIGRTPWTGDQPVTRPLPTHRTTHTQNKRKQTSMPQVGFEPTIPVFERAKTVHALGCAATVIG